MLVNLPTHLVLEVNQCAVYGINLITLLSSNSILWLWCMCMNFFEKVLIARSASMHAAWGTTKFLEPCNILGIVSFIFLWVLGRCHRWPQPDQQLPGRLLCLLYWVSERKFLTQLKKKKSSMHGCTRLIVQQICMPLPIKLSHYEHALLRTFTEDAYWATGEYSIQRYWNVYSILDWHTHFMKNPRLAS